MAKRVFVYDGREHADPDPAMSPEQVRQHYANFFPELANGAHSGPVKRGDEEVWTLQKRVGTKGAL